MGETQHSDDAAFPRDELRLEVEVRLERINFGYDVGRGGRSPSQTFAGVLKQAV